MKIEWTQNYQKKLWFLCRLYASIWATIVQHVSWVLACHPPWSRTSKKKNFMKNLWHSIILMQLLNIWLVQVKSGSLHGDTTWNHILLHSITFWIYKLARKKCLAKIHIAFHWRVEVTGCDKLSLLIPTISSHTEWHRWLFVTERRITRNIAAS